MSFSDFSHQSLNCDRAAAPKLCVERLLERVGFTFRTALQLARPLLVEFGGRQRQTERPFVNASAREHALGYHLRRPYG